MGSRVNTRSFRIIRSGPWHIISEGARGADRTSIAPNFRNSYLGFRLVKTVKADKQVEKWREEVEEGLFNEK